MLEANLKFRGNLPFCYRSAMIIDDEFGAGKKIDTYFGASVQPYDLQF